MAVDSNNDVPSRTNRPRRMAKTNRATKTDRTIQEMKYSTSLESKRPWLMASKWACMPSCTTECSQDPRTEKSAIAPGPTKHTTEATTDKRNDTSGWVVSEEATKPRPVNAPEKTTKPT